MYKFLALAFVAFVAAEELHLTRDLLPASNPYLINDVNTKQSSWVAGVNSVFKDRTFGELKKLMGVLEVRPANLPRQTYETVAAAPDSFDSRTQWPGLIGPILNQADCGSCWAFGCVESVSDRLAIASNNFTQFSPLDLTSCDMYDGGCDGGNLETAWEYVKQHGLVTLTCMPYLQSNGGPVPTCPPDQQPCLNFIKTPECPSTCHDGSEPHAGVFADKIYSVQGEDDYKTELSTNGPFEVAMTVYEDFVNYKSGVYKHTTGQALGGHAIKVIGYGTENGEAYWLVQNSWTTTWGDGGYFKIARGNDECGIESSGVAGTVSSTKPF